MHSINHLTFDKSFDAFDKLFDAFDKPFDAFDKPFDTFDKSFDESFDVFDKPHSIKYLMQDSQVTLRHNMYCACAMPPSVNLDIERAC